MDNIPVWEKPVISVQETSELFGIGINRIYDLVKTDGKRFCIKIGRKILINRKRFEKFIDNVTEL